MVDESAALFSIGTAQEAFVGPKLLVKDGRAS